MKPQELEITIGNDGKVVVHVNGVQGEECTGLTKTLEQAIGTVEDRVMKAEYYEQPVTDRTNIRAREK